MEGRQASLSLSALILFISLPASGDWRLAGPFGGSARSIAIDPANRSILLAGTRDSLLFRSDDAGATWNLLRFPPGTPGTFNALLIDPRASGHFYAGLDAGDSRDSGVYESRDGGEHWSALEGVRGLRIESLAMAPEDGRVLAAGTSQGVFLTKDGGETWSRISVAGNPEMQDITALAFDPVHSSTIYAGTPHLPWKTSDEGANWHSIATGLIDDSDIFSIHVDPKRPERMLASACSGIYRSENAGEQWTKLRGIPGTHRRTHIIAQDPNDPDIIYAGTTLGLFKSMDAGASWQHLNAEQVNWMVFDPGDPRILYLATEYAGILKSPDAGKTFLAVNRGFVQHNLTGITGAGSRVYASSIYEGTHGGVFESLDGGMNWTLRSSEAELGGRNLNSLAVAPSKESLLFAASANELLKSVDGGQTWSRLPIQPKLDRSVKAQHFGQLRIQSLQVVEGSRLALFVGTQYGLFRSADGGASWERVAAKQLGTVPVHAIYAPARGCSRLAVATGLGLFVSTDGGNSWRPAPLPAGNSYIYDVALSPDPSAPILAGTSRGLLQSTNDGAQWKLVTGVPAATVSSVRFNPEHALEAFLVQYGKVYHSLDGGTSWQLFPSDGLASAGIHKLWLSPDIPGRIFALSAARGALFYDIAQPDVARQADHTISSK